MPKQKAATALVPMVQEVHAALWGTPPARAPFVSWYAYVATKSTVRERDGRLWFRVSDHLEDAPPEVLRGLFAVLLCRLQGKRLPARVRGDAMAYEAHVHAGPAAERRGASRRRRGSKFIDPIGDHRSLLESYLRVALETGIVLAEPPVLSWSRTRSRNRFGHQDPDHGCIVLSRVLDDPKVPEFVLDYVVYHELLHIVHPPVQGSGSKRIIHHGRFRDAERRFARRAEAERWLERLSRGT